jgi:SAM-dependent methyltransferase
MNPMVEPQYVGRKPKADIRLAGKILIFGSGGLTHERLFFNFDKAKKITLYDPAHRTEPSLFGKKATYFDDLDKALRGGPFDTVLSLFSLHYEPQWLSTLEKLWTKLRKGGTIYFAEDRGFRALLDNNSSPEVLEHDLKNGNWSRAILPAFHQREVEIAAPWYPDISASDYGLVFEILCLSGSRTETIRGELNRQFNPPSEPQCYLPWRKETNPALTDDCLTTLKQALPKSGTVREVVVVRGFRKERDFPNVHDVNSDLGRTVWHLVTRHAAEQITKVRVPPNAHHERETRDGFARAFLHTAYLNVFRHFRCVGTAEIVLGFHTKVGVEQAEDGLKFDPHLPPCQFSTSGRMLRLDFDPPPFLKKYMLSRQSNTETKYLAHELCERGLAGLLLWAPPEKFWPGRKDFLSRQDSLPKFQDIRSEFHDATKVDLARLCCDWGVPFCLYMLGSFAHVRVADQQNASKEKIVAACVVYFVHNELYLNDPDAPLPNDYDFAVLNSVPALMFTAPAVIDPLAGPSAYLELTFKEHFLEKKLQSVGLLSQAKQELTEKLNQIYKEGSLTLTVQNNGHGMIQQEGSPAEYLNPTETEFFRWVFQKCREGVKVFRGQELLTDLNRVLSLNQTKVSDVLRSENARKLIKLENRQLGTYSLDCGSAPSPTVLP